MEWVQPTPAGIKTGGLVRARAGLWLSALPVRADPPHMPRNAVNAPLTLLPSNMIGYACSCSNSEEGRIADVLGHVLVSPSRRREPAAPGSPSRTIPSPIYCSRGIHQRSAFQRFSSSIASRPAVRSTVFEAFDSNGASTADFLTLPRSRSPSSADLVLSRRQFGA